MKLKHYTLEEHILNRDYFPILKVSLKKILDNTGMKQYHTLCFARIQDARLIDNVEVKYDRRERDDLLLTGRGIAKCYDIISGYIDGKTLEDIAKDIDYHNEYAEQMNNIIRTLRKQTTKTLKELKDINLSYTDDLENRNFITHCISVELESRTLRNRIRAFCEFLK